jgi:hypothetical protein
MPRTATNPQTGERVELIDGQWVPITPTSAIPAEDPSYLGGLGRNIRQGGTLGWGDEIVAGLGALGAGAPGSERYGQAYDRIRQDEERQAAQFAKQNPGAALAANIFGGVGTGGGLAKAAGALAPQAVQAMQSIPAWARALGGGTAGGMIAGAGENANNRLQGATIGGATGMVLGPAMQLGAKYGGKFINVLKDKYFTGPVTKGKRAVFEALQREGLTPQDAETLIRSYGDDAVLADAGGKVRTLAAGIEALPEAPRAQYEAMLRARHAAQQDQLMGTIEQATGRTGQTRNYQLALEAARKGETAPLYAQAYATPTQMTDTLSRAMGLPEVQRAYMIGHRIAQREAGEVLPKAAWDAKTGQWTNPPSTMEWDWIQRGLRQTYDAEMRAGKRDAARAVLDLRRKVLGELDIANTDFAAARLAHATGKQIEDALDAGKRFFREKDDELLAETFGQMSDPEKGAYLNGVVNAIRQRVRSIGSNRDVSVQTWLRSPEFGDRMRMLFGDDAAGSIFKQLDVLGEKAITKNQLLHQSMTADKTAIREMMEGGEVGDAVRQALSGNMLGSADAVRRAVSTGPRVNPEQAAEAAKLLLTPVGQWTDPLADQLRGVQLSPFWQRRAAGETPGLLPLFGSGLANLLLQ